MNLIQRVACSRNKSRRVKEARQLLKVTPGHATSLIQRIAASDGDSQRAEGARQLLRAVRPERSTMPGCSSSLMRRVVTGKRAKTLN